MLSFSFFFLNQADAKVFKIKRTDLLSVNKTFNV